MKRKRIAYTPEDDEYLRNAWHSTDQKVIIEHLPGHSWDSISHHARALGLSRKSVRSDCTLSTGEIRRVYSAEDDAYLRQHYSRAPKDEITNHLGRSWSGIRTHARTVLGLSRPKIRSHALSALLDANHINAYWWGFIMADGHLSDRGHLIVSLGNRDRLHLERLVQHIGVGVLCDEAGNMVRYAVSDRYNGKLLRERLNFSNAGPKTYHPPTSLSFLTHEDLSVSFLIGLIDGDGSITYDHNGTFKSIRILVHASWEGTLRELAVLTQGPLGRLATTGSSNSRGNASFYLGTKDVYERLSQHISDHDLPALARKWNQ